MKSSRMIIDDCGNDSYYKESEPEDSIDIEYTDNETDSDGDIVMTIEDVLYEDSEDDDSDSDYEPSEVSEGEEEIEQLIEVIRENKKRILKSESITLSKRHKQE